MRDGILQHEKLTPQTESDECEAAAKWIEDNIKAATSHIAGLTAMKSAVKEYA